MVVPHIIWTKYVTVDEKEDENELHGTCGHDVMGVERLHTWFCGSAGCCCCP
jgi:hypothetical protein